VCFEQPPRGEGGPLLLVSLRGKAGWPADPPHVRYRKLPAEQVIPPRQAPGYSMHAITVTGIVTRPKSAFLREAELSSYSFYDRFLRYLLAPRRLSENSVRSEIERKFRRQGGKGKITGGIVNAKLRIFWPFQRGRRSLQPIAAEGYCRTASRYILGVCQIRSKPQPSHNKKAGTEVPTPLMPKSTKVLSFPTDLFRLLRGTIPGGLT